MLVNFEYDKIDTEYLSEYVEKYSENDYLKDRRPAKTSFDFIVSKDRKTGIIGSYLKFFLPIEFDDFRKKRNLYNLNSINKRPIIG